MSQRIQEFIKDHSIDNLRTGTVISKDDTTYVIKVGSAEITCQFSGGANVGEVVTLECPDGDLNKAYILEVAPIGIGGGETVAI